MNTNEASFDALGLSPPLLKAIEDAGYDSPTPIQQSSIPPILDGADIIGIAQTGTGKTAAFTLPLIDILSRGRARARMARSLILSPTRELAQQTAENFKLYGKHCKLTHALLIGGVSMDKQKKNLARGADVLIATPGRLLDHSQRGRLLLNSIEILVVDEGDRMLDMGFIPDIERILKLLPPGRQTLLFSATMPPPMEKLAKKFMRDPVRLSASNTGMAAQTITQTLLWTQDREKMELLTAYLKEVEDNAIIFCNRKRDVDRVHKALQQRDFDVEPLHGDMTQYRRTKVLNRFRSEKLQILVASNVAARGLDIANISNVVNYDVPQQAEDYVHRIGRTGRAGKEGKAWTLATAKELDYVKAIEALLGIPFDATGDVPTRKAGAGGGRPSRSRNSKPRAKRAYGDSSRGSSSRGNSSRGDSSRGDSSRGDSSRTKRSESGERPARGERSARGERTDRGERTGRGERSEHNGRGERTERGEHTARSERTERGERGARSDSAPNKKPYKAAPHKAAPHKAAKKRSTRSNASRSNTKKQLPAFLSR